MPLRRGEVAPFMVGEASRYCRGEASYSRGDRAPVCIFYGAYGAATGAALFFSTSKIRFVC